MSDPPKRVPREARRSLADEIADGLREDILAGRLEPGDRVGELEIAEQYGTSQAPVREAFALLRSEAVLLALPRRGTFVSSVSLPDARAAYEVRIRLDPYVTNDVLSRVTGHDLHEMGVMVDSMREAAARLDFQEMTRHDMAFHGYLYGLCDSDILSRIWDLVSLSVRQFIAVAGRQYFAEEEYSDIADMHALLLDLIRQGNADMFQEELKRQLDVMWLRIDASNPDAAG